MPGPTTHTDGLTSDNWPTEADMLAFLPDDFPSPGHPVAAVGLMEKMVKKGIADRIALEGTGRNRSYAAPVIRSIRITRAPVENYGMLSLNRILIRPQHTGSACDILLAPVFDARPRLAGRPLDGCQAMVVDDEMTEVPGGGCALADGRQRKFVKQGWTLPGDPCIQDEAGYFRLAARSDDRIASAGYAGAGPEPEAVLFAHPDVPDCGVIGATDSEQGIILQPHFMLRDRVLPRPETAKVPPRTVSGKIRRSARKRAAETPH